MGDNETVTTVGNGFELNQCHGVIHSLIKIYENWNLQLFTADVKVTEIINLLLASLLSSGPGVGA